MLNEAFEQAGNHLIDIVRGRDWSTPLTTCPGQDVSWIIAHIGVLNTWAAAMMAAGAAEPFTREQLNLDIPDDQDGRQAWLETVMAKTAGVFSETPDGAPVWTLAGPGTARFWKRRLLHEAVVHAVDVEIGLQLPRAAIDDRLAGDGIDELLDLLPVAPRPEGKFGTGAQATLAFVAPDTTTWHIKWAPPMFTWQRDGEHHADVRVTATMADLYLYLYGRPAHRIEVRGDYAVLERWREATKL